MLAPAAIMHSFSPNPLSFIQKCQNELLQESTNIKRRVRFSTAVLLSVATGCSAFKPSHQTLTVEVTDPPHAGVWMNTKYVGDAPVHVSVIRDHNVDVLVKKEGFQSATHTVHYHVNATGVLDIIGAWLVIFPFIGVIAPGHDSLDETTVVMHLAPDSGTNAAVRVETIHGAEQSKTNEPADSLAKSGQDPISSTWPSENASVS
jgi:hypothetical protein